mmetsp:Transcript_52855/g.92826  ORF Transcript_52855/g.92826 Transcript_52855/m.92826 type:complete len:203 (+) Transcript_52855:630-1238(+)
MKPWVITAASSPPAFFNSESRSARFDVGFTLAFKKRSASCCAVVSVERRSCRASSRTQSQPAFRMARSPSCEDMSSPKALTRAHSRAEASLVRRMPSSRRFSSSRSSLSGFMPSSSPATPSSSASLWCVQLTQEYDELSWLGAMSFKASSMHLFKRFVTCDTADTTTHGRSPAERTRFTSSMMTFQRSAVATDVPPNFNTTH